MRTILLTGATDGIGLALARAWQRRGERLLLHGRREEREVRECLPQGAAYVRADLADHAAPAAIAAQLDARGIEGLDLLVHNAGAGWYGAPEEQSDASVDELLRVNLEAPIELTRLLLPRVEAARGAVVFVSSVLAALPAPDYAVYAASKAALEGFARALRVEVAGRVRVQVVRPGGTRTGMHAKSGAPAHVREKSFPTAEAVAGRIARAIDGGSRRAVIGLGNRALCAAGELLAGPVDALARRSRR